jgi:hypothetical protein
MALRSSASYALSTTLSMARGVPVEERASLFDEMYKLSRNDMFRMNVFIYDILTSSWAVGQMYTAVDAISVGYGDYVMEVLGPDALRGYLLYKPTTQR